MTNNDTNRTTAMNLLEGLADPGYLEVIKEKMDNHYSWVTDRHYPDAILLMCDDDERDVLVIVYPKDEDFEQFLDWDPRLS